MRAAKLRLGASRNLGGTHISAFVLLLSLLAIKVRNERFHAAFAVFALLSEIFYYLRLFFTLA
jgi:hypothetical protein